MIGETFGHWTVLEKDIRRGKNNRQYWLCQCKCGTNKPVDGTSLRSGKSKSCGCARNEWHALPKGKAARNETLATYKKKAEERGYEWGISGQFFDELVKMPCFYCGTLPSNIKRKKHKNGHFVYSGIDRVDNALGYLPDNVVPCCADCNRTKDTMTTTEFAEYITRLYTTFLT